MRKFWANISTEGRTIGTGPRGKDNDMTVTVYKAVNGESVEACSIWCHVMKDGTLAIRIFNTEQADVVVAKS